MTRVRKLNVSQVEGNDANNTDSDEIRPFGEIGIYENTDNGAIKPELLMFDGNRTHLRSKVLSKGTFYGGDADGGDGTGVDTIKLIPDAVLHRNGGNYGNDQYLIIDPTGGEPNHIHIRAGGTIDGSSTDLFLGGEKNNVRVSDINDRVTITTDFGIDGQTRTWTFNNNGGLQLPGSSNGLIGEDEPGVVIRSDLGFALVTNANTDSSKAWIFDGQGGLRLPGSATIENTATVLAAGTIIEVPLNAAGDTEDYVGGASVLEIPKNTDTDQVQAGWIITFSNDVQRTITGVLDGGLYWSAQYAEANPGLGTSTYPLTIQSANYNEGFNGNVTIGLNDLEGSLNEFVFGADGQLTVPGAIRKDGSLYLNSGGDEISATVLVFGDTGSVILRTGDGTSTKSLTLDVAGETTLPGRLNFSDGSSYSDHRLSGDIDSDLAFEVFNITTVSAEAIVGSSQDLLVVDISEDDDITVVGAGWEINAGTGIAPQWMAVVSTDIVPGDTCSINVPDFDFIAGFTYTFRNPVPESKSWTIRSQTGGLVGPGGVIVTNETYPLDGGGTYRELAIELQTPDGQNDQRWTFANDGSLTLPQYSQIESDGSNATITLNGAASNESSIYLATNLDGETITTTFEMHPNGVGLNSVRSIDIHAGYDGGTFKYDAWQAAEQDWTDNRNQDAITIAPDTRPWAGMPSYQAYNEILLYTAPPGVLPQPDSLVVIANIAKAAYELWQAEQAAINVTVGATDRTWTFGANGTMTFPDSTVQTTAYTGNLASAIRLGYQAGSINQSSTDPVAVGNQAGRSNQGAYAVSVGANAGSLNQGTRAIAIGVLAGDNTQGAGAVAIGSNAGNSGQGANAIAIGYYAGIGAQHANSIVLNATGSALNGSAPGFHVAPVRNQNTNNNILTYDTTTNEIAYRTDIRVEGEWTVTTSTNNYSFTVPTPGTYTMWVRGTTDNGVISWNATVTITNTNLPALGQQQAYAYSGAGTLLDFTSLPSQIIGAAGTVTRSTTLLGTSSGLFEFGISNTSPGDVTVYWGWTKI